MDKGDSDMWAHFGEILGIWTLAAIPLAIGIGKLLGRRTTE